MNFQDKDSTSRQMAIEAQGLTKLFGEVHAVDGLDLQVPVGTVFSLLGPNGSGKTTTVRMLATLLKPDRGSARVNGYDVGHQAQKVRETISLTGQFAALDPNLTARENLQLIARLRGRNRREAAQHHGPTARALRCDRVRGQAHQAAVRRPEASRRPGRGAGREAAAAGARRADHGLDPRSRQVGLVDDP